MQYEVISLKTGIFEIRDQLKQMASEGWDLVTIVHQPDSVSSEAPTPYLAYFKKE